MSTATKPTSTYFRVTDAIAKVIIVEREKVIPTAVLADLGCDSLDKFEILIELEDEFDVQMNDTVATNWMTIQDVLDSLVEYGVKL